MAGARVIDAIKVRVPIDIIDRKDWIKYLILVNWHGKELGEIVQRSPDVAFGQFVEAEVQKYLKGATPPAGIKSAVMNIADDLLGGREFVLKSGDYIALQEQFRAAKG